MNLKPFSLSAAQAGEPVVVVDSDDQKYIARIVDFKYNQEMILAVVFVSPKERTMVFDFEGTGGMFTLMHPCKEPVTEWLNKQKYAWISFPTKEAAELDAAKRPQGYYIAVAVEVKYTEK